MVFIGIKEDFKNLLLLFIIKQGRRRIKVKYSTYLVSSNLKIDHQFFFVTLFVCRKILILLSYKCCLISYKKKSRFRDYNTKGKKLKP